MKKAWSKLCTIYGLVLGFFLIRLIGITLPPLETWHSWRQTLTNMMARNMAEGSFSYFYPVVDMGGERTGIIGSEFPFFQSLIAGCTLFFGEAHWYGRLINLIVSSFAVIAFFHLCKRWWNERTAWYATVIFLTSLWFAFSRKCMPDTFAVSLVIIGIYWFQRYIDQRNWWKLVLGLCFITLGGLCKIPAVFLFGLMVPMWMKPSLQIRLKLTITIAVGIASSIIGWWYFVWVPHLVDTYHFALFFPKGIAEGLHEIAPLWGDFAAQVYFGALRSYVVLLPILVGIIWLGARQNRLALAGTGILTAIFFVFAIKTGTVFPTHNYYVLPFVPVMAVVAAFGLQRMDKRLATALLFLIMAEGIGNQISDFRVKDEVRYKLTLEQQVNQLVPKGEIIIIHAGPNPEWMYCYHRKGWSLHHTEITDA
ncbi:MAG: glycosyltransferase family 39 protein, partial [Flavobacteriia bacterium]|nr:glycosyltransferase family 39 protein [Flavobacteriia bacterium]